MHSPTAVSLVQVYKRGELNEEQVDFFTTPRADVELYHTPTDKYQEHNIIADDYHTKRYLKVLHRWQHDTCDSMPDNLTPDWCRRENLTRNEHFFKSRGVRAEGARQ